MLKTVLLQRVGPASLILLGLFVIAAWGVEFRLVGVVVSPARETIGEIVEAPYEPNGSIQVVRADGSTGQTVAVGQAVAPLRAEIATSVRTDQEYVAGRIAQARMGVVPSDPLLANVPAVFPVRATPVEPTVAAVPSPPTALPAPAPTALPTRAVATPVPVEPEVANVVPTEEDEDEALGSTVPDASPALSVEETVVNPQPIGVSTARPAVTLPPTTAPGSVPVAPERPVAPAVGGSEGAVAGVPEPGPGTELAVAEVVADALQEAPNLVAGDPGTTANQPPTAPPSAVPAVLTPVSPAAPPGGAVAPPVSDAAATSVGTVVDGARGAAAGAVAAVAPGAPTVTIGSPVGGLTGGDTGQIGLTPPVVLPTVTALPGQVATSVPAVLTLVVPPAPTVPQVTVPPLPNVTLTAPALPIPTLPPVPGVPTLTLPVGLPPTIAVPTVPVTVPTLPVAVPTLPVAVPTLPVAVPTLTLPVGGLLRASDDPEPPLAELPGLVPGVLGVVGLTVGLVVSRRRRL
jgi:hypothetical protein